MKTLESFNLSTRSGRYAARIAGFDVPKLKPGIKQNDFWSYVDKKDVNECWPWKRHTNKWGYGRFRFNGINSMAHRVAYVLTTGENIDNLVAMHTCDNPICCNPNHLIMGTHADNQADKFNKNRQAKGETNGNSVLTEKMVLDAREEYARGNVTYQDLANKYAVSKDTMQKAIRKIYWKHI